MRQVIANSVGTNWRNDVSHGARFDAVEVIDLDNKRLGIVSTVKDSLDRVSYQLNYRRVSFDTIWNEMHKWSDVIAAQNTRDYQRRITQA